MYSSISCPKRKPYVSCFTIQGHPILPPVMTREKINEMQQYKKLAIALELKLKIQNNVNNQEMSSMKEMMSSEVMSNISKEDTNIVNKRIEANIEHLNEEIEKRNSSQSDGFVTDDTKLQISSNIVSEQKKRDDVNSKNENNILYVLDDNTNYSSESDSLNESCDETILQKPVDNAENKDHNELETENINLNNEVALYMCNRISDKPEEITELGDLRKSNASCETYINECISDFNIKVVQKNDLDEGSDTLSVKSEKRRYFSEIETTDYFKTCWLHWNDYNTPTETFTSPGPVIVEGLGVAENEQNREIQDLNTEVQETACMSKSSNVSVLSSRTCTDQSTPPSLASTELNKYMNISPEAMICPHLTVSATTIETVSDLPEDSDVTHPENDDSISQNSTLNSGSACTTKFKCQLDEFRLTKKKVEDYEINCDKFQNKQESFTPPKLVRRLSYTLECPSPALIAHAEECEKNGLPIKNDMSSVRRHSYPMLSPAVPLRENFSEQAIKSEVLITSQEDDNFSFLNNKKDHLCRYLENLSKCPSRTEKYFSDCVKEKEFYDNEEETVICLEERNAPGKKSSTDSFVQKDSLEEILKEKQKYYEEMRLQLEMEHQQQMEMLMRRQRKEELYLCEQFLNESENVNDTKQTLDLGGNLGDSNQNSKLKKPKYFPSPIVSEPIIKTNYTAQFPLLRESKENISLNISTTSNQSRKSLCPWLSIDQKLTEKNIDPSLQKKFNRLSAAVKGYLTRRLLMTERVQQIIKTIRDTLEFALAFNEETPMKTGRISPAEIRLHNRIVSQLTGACYDFHDIFFKLSTAERMNIIAQDRRIKKEKAAKNQPKRNLSSATIKSLERKKKNMQGDSIRCQFINRSKSTLPWSFSPKRRKVSNEILSRSHNTKLNPRPKTTSPQLYKSSYPLGNEKNFCSAKKSLVSIYSPSSSKPKSSNGNRTFRVSLRNRFPSGNITAPSSVFKNNDHIPAWK